MTTRFPVVEYSGDLEHVGSAAEESSAPEPNTSQSNVGTAD
jgi:hypothetical protein